MKTTKSLSFEPFVYPLLFGCTMVSVLVTMGILAILFSESIEFFRNVSLWEFLFGTKWSPLLLPRSFGVLPLVVGTMHIVIISCLFAMPIGLFSAVYLNEFASSKTRSILKPTLEVLAGIPTVVYGYFALTFLTPVLRYFLPETGVFNSFSAALVVGIMILPMICSLCDDAIASVPKDIREGAYAMGATSLETITKVIIPAALSGIIASFILALSRAIGETMIVTLAAGATPNLSLDPMQSVQTMTAYIVQVSLGDTPAGSVSYQTIFAVAGLLFLITFAINWIANLILKKYREVY